MKFSTTLLTLVTSALAAPSPNHAIPTYAIRPSYLSQYAVWSGAITFNTGMGQMTKTQTSSDITTLLEFMIPDTAVGKMCTMHLALDDTSTVTGTMDFQVFSSLYPAAASTTGWGPGNGRDQYLGYMTAMKGAAATTLSFKCPSAGSHGWEFVPKGDMANIKWTQTMQWGAYMTYY